MIRRQHVLAAGLLVVLLVLLAGEAGAQSWKQLVPATSTSPAPRWNASAVYDEAGKSLVVFGGRNAQGVLNEVWSFNLDSLRWRNLTPASGDRPAPRFSQNAVYDPLSRRLVIWAGQGGDGLFFNDLWSFDLSSYAWQKMSPQGTVPHARYGSAAVYDPVMRRLVAFAGFTDAGRFDDTQAYEIAANRWTDLSPSGTRPQLRCLHTACYDSLRHRMIIYGGQRSDRLDDIWAFDLALQQWTNLTPSVRPAGRTFPTSICEGNRVLVFGGHTNDGDVNELWSFDLLSLQWDRIMAQGTGPAARNSHASVYLPGRRAMLIFGGTGANAYNDVWEYTERTTEVGEAEQVPAEFHLEQNYPNPFNPETRIRFALGSASRVTLKVYTALGQEVATLVDGWMERGSHEVRFDGKGLSSGVYLYRIAAEGRSAVRSMALVR